VTTRGTLLIRWNNSKLVCLVHLVETKTTSCLGESLLECRSSFGEEISSFYLLRKAIEVGVPEAISGIARFDPYSPYKKTLLSLCSSFLQNHL
jgi:hypothetical protein